MHRRVRRIERTICVPDRNGIVGDAVLGFNTIVEYEHDKLYVGALIGRYANRIRMDVSQCGAVRAGG